MKSSRKHYEEFPVMTDAEVMARLDGLSGRELSALHHYALGREEGDRRDRALICLMMEGGSRYLAKQAAKAAKKAKRIL